MKYRQQLLKKNNKSKNSHGILCMFHRSLAHSFVFRNEEKRVAFLVYSSSRRVAISRVRTFSVFTSSGSHVIQAERKW